MDSNLDHQKSGKKRLDFHFRYHSTAGSQSWRMYSYLQEKGPQVKKLECHKALLSYFLVEGLKEKGLREREDLQKIAKRCYDDLINQAEKIAKLAGLEHNGDQLTSSSAGYDSASCRLPSSFQVDVPSGQSSNEQGNIAESMMDSEQSEDHDDPFEDEESTDEDEMDGEEFEKFLHSEAFN